MLCFLSVLISVHMYVHVMWVVVALRVCVCECMSVGTWEQGTGSLPPIGLLRLAAVSRCKIPSSFILFKKYIPLGKVIREDVGAALLKSLLLTCYLNHFVLGAQKYICVMLPPKRCAFSRSYASNPDIS